MFSCKYESVERFLRTWPWIDCRPNQYDLVVASSCFLPQPMANRNRYLDHDDPQYQRWGRAYRKFSGVAERTRLILNGQATGAWADIVHFDLAENADQYLDEIIVTFNQHLSNDVAVYMVMALETAAIPRSAEFLSDLLRNGDERVEQYARRALIAINTRESRTALFNVGEG